MYTNGLKDRFGSPLISKRDGDKVYAQLEAENTFTANNTFEQEVQLENGATANNNINVESGNIIVNKEGVLIT